jgi:hypothetical protein
MKKFIDRLFKDFNSIIIILIILIVPLYIIYFGKYLDDKTVNILIAVAAIVSTCFLYLAFRESKKSNQLKIYEVEFSYLENRVREQEKKANERIFSSEDIEFINDIIPLSRDLLKNVTYSRFVHTLSAVFSTVEKDPTYILIKEKYGKNGHHFVPIDKNGSKIIELSSALEKLQMSIFRVASESFMDIAILYKSIHYSSILKEQKELLINRLNRISADYSYLAKNKDKESEVLSVLKNFKNFEVTANGEINEVKIRNSGFLDSFFYESFGFEDIMEQYRVRLI